MTSFNSNLANDVDFSSKLIEEGWLRMEIGASTSIWWLSRNPGSTEDAWPSALKLFEAVIQTDKFLLQCEQGSWITD